MPYDIKRISRYKLLCASSNGCLYYHKGSLYFSKAPEMAVKKFVKLPCSGLLSVLSKMRLMERLLRLEPRFAVPYESGFLLSWNGGLHYLDATAGTIQCVHHYRTGMNNPLGITKIEGIRGFTDGYVYGDYWGNTEKATVNVYRLEQFEPQCVYSFAPGEVLHIHGITADKQSGRVLICTGDGDEESAIWEVFDDFKVVKPVVRGSQIYRTCAAYVTDGGILYATDTPLQDNGIYLYSEQEKQVRKLCDIPGPCIYSLRIQGDGKEDQYVFATSVEPDSSLPYWRYRFTYQLGNGVKERWVNIIAGNPRDGFSTVTRMKKDVLPMLLLQFGNASFPWQEATDRLYLTPIAVKHFDGRTVMISKP